MTGVDRSELESIRDMVLNLAVQFLHDEHAAEEAAQEIFLKAQEAISGFRGESSLGTWIYRIAYNYLVDQSRLKFRDEISFELFERDVSDFEPFGNEIGLSREEMEIYVEQVKIGCTKAMLQCLDPTDRFVFILGNIFDFSGKDGASICGLSEAAYRQRLSRASKKITSFMSKNCGLLYPEATCQCGKRIGIALERGRINPEMLLYRTKSKTVRETLTAMNELDSIAAIFRGNPYIEKARMYTEEIDRLVNALAFTPT